MILEKFSYENIEACFNIQLGDDQKAYVTSNTISISHAFLELQEGNMIPYPYLIKEGDAYVGFIMLSYCKADPNYPEYKNAADSIVLFVEPDNEAAIRLYESCGFTKTNEQIDGEIKYIRELDHSAN